MLIINVNYILSEYISILKQFAPVASAKEKNITLSSANLKLSLWDKFTVYALGSFMFALKVRKVGLCTFHIDKEGFSRKSNVGEKFISWKKVINIHQLSNAYLMELEQGFIPLPLRCFDNIQRINFEAIVAPKLITSTLSHN